MKECICLRAERKAHNKFPARSNFWMLSIKAGDSQQRIPTRASAVSLEALLVVDYIENVLITVCFTKLLTNGFWNSFEIPKVHYELGNFIYRYLSIKSWTLKWSCVFHAELHWEVKKFIVREVHTIWFKICLLSRWCSVWIMFLKLVQLVFFTKWWGPKLIACWGNTVKH